MTSEWLELLHHPHLSCLHQIRQHDNHTTLPVMHHLPKVLGSGLHGALSDDEGSPMLVSLGRMVLERAYLHEILSVQSCVNNTEMH